MVRRLRNLDPSVVPRVLLLLAIFATPVIFDVGTVKPFDAVKATTLWVFVWAAFGAWLVQVLRGRISIQRPWMAYLWVAFLAAMGLATAFSKTPVVSLFGIYGRYNGLLELVLFVQLAALVAQLYRRRPERAREFFFALGAASTVVVVYILIQLADLDPVGWSRPTGEPLAFRYFGTLGNSNFAGGFLGATMPWLLFAFLRSTRVWQRLLVAGWAVVTLGALWLTASRGGLVAALLAGLVAVSVFRRRLPRWILPAGGVAAAIAAVVAVLVVWHPGMSAPPRPLDDLRVLRSETLEVRTFWWQAALGVYAANPIVGAGPDTFIVTYPRHVPEASAGVGDAETADKPHNVVLEYASSTGTLGLVTFLLVVGSAAWWGLRRMRALHFSGGIGPGGIGVEESVVGSSMALLAGYLGQAFFSIDVAPLAVVGWVAIGSLVAMADPAFLVEEPQPSTPSRRPPAWARWVAVGLVVLVTAMMVAVGVRPWRADRAADDGEEAKGAGQRAGIALRAYESALALHPFEPFYYNLTGSYLIRRAGETEFPERRGSFLREALRHFERADELQPDHHLWTLQVADVLGRLGSADEEARFREAEIWLDRAAELAPVDWRVPVQRGLMYTRWALATNDPARHCDALEAYRRSIGLDERQSAVWIELSRSLSLLGLFERAEAALERARRLDPEAQGFDELGQLIERLAEQDRPVVRCGRR